MAVPADAQHVRSTSSRAFAPTRSTSTTPRAGACCAPPSRPSPRRSSERRAKVRDLLGDMATLPAQQRHALLRREIDGVSHAALARRARRVAAGDEEPRAPRAHEPRQAARGALARLPRASAPTCSRRTTRAAAPRPPSYRHLASCGECRAFRGGLRDTRKAAAILMPVPLMIVAFGLLTGKAAAATAKGAMVKSRRDRRGGRGDHRRRGRRRRPGLPAPATRRRRRPTSRALPAGSLAKGGALPKGTAIVRRTVPLAGGGVDRRRSPARPGCASPT